jgi:K+/H+ antiporter YhaU regulatory subunit KhtT
MPHPDEVIRARDTLVVITTPETFEALKRLVAEGPAPDAG